MKKDIHPIYYSDAKIICACGNNFSIGSTIKEIHVEICSKCHPFYTGKQKLIDTAGRVDRFKARLAKKEILEQKNPKRTPLGQKTKERKNKRTQERKNKKTKKQENKNIKIKK